MMEKYHKNLLLGVVIVVSVIAGLFWSEATNDDQPGGYGKVKIAASLTLSPSPIWIAKDKGFFEEVGLDVEVVKYLTGKATTEAMLRGETDLSASAEFLITKMSFSNKDLRILGTTAFVHQIKLLGIKEKGIASIADLRGKRIGVRLGTNGEYFLNRLLALHSIKASEVELINVKPPKMIEALSNDSVDAVLIWPPFVQHLQTEFGDRLVSFDGQPHQDYYYVLVGTENWIANNKKQAEQVLMALKKAERWITSNPESAEIYFSEKFNIEKQKVADALSGYRFSISLPQSLLTAIENIGSWIDKSKLSEGNYMNNSLNLVEMSPLLRVDESSVTMIKVDNIK
jgi:NitT/TauT family transport system substrate-binding protein